jgi:threonylcarbamoyladenosine tRNA methylthiotransferase MtaB
MIDLWSDRRLCRHFHLALQSGSESVLERMRRRYSAAEYRAAVEHLRRAIPDVAITTDVIAGFPGESDDEFEETMSFCRQMEFAAMHVFPYSQRSGTAAMKMDGQVADQVKKERVHRLMALGDQMAASYRRGFVGSEQEVLWETAAAGTGEPVWQGLTDTYIRVYAESREDLENRITQARITEVCEGGLRGML